MTEQEREWEEDVNRQLDEDPANWDLRRVYADRLNEWDRHDESLVQRFMADKKKHPGKYEGTGWYWMFYKKSDPADPQDDQTYVARLSWDYFRGLQMPPTTSTFGNWQTRNYKTRSEAELDLARALDSHRQWLNRLYGA